MSPANAANSNTVGEFEDRAATDWHLEAGRMWAIFCHEGEEQKVEVLKSTPATVPFHPKQRSSAAVYERSPECPGGV